MVILNMTIQPRIATLPHSYAIPPRIATLVAWDHNRTVPPRIACVPGYCTCPPGDGEPPCAVPWQRDALGRWCGKRSSIIKPGGDFAEVSALIALV